MSFSTRQRPRWLFASVTRTCELTTSKISDRDRSLDAGEHDARLFSANHDQTAECTGRRGDVGGADRDASADSLSEDDPGFRVDEALDAHRVKRGEAFA